VAYNLEALARAKELGFQYIVHNIIPMLSRSGKEYLRRLGDSLYLHLYGLNCKHPPSMKTTCPVMKSDAGEAEECGQVAISSTLPHPPHRNTGDHPCPQVRVFMLFGESFGVELPRPIAFTLMLYSRPVERQAACNHIDARLAHV